jgi:catechol 2,3-dioxygenase-like lactoylglutathione lyase family enzyme
VKAQLTHIAISAVNPRIMKTFYTGVFGLKPNSPSPDGFLTDGYINFAFNYRKPGYQAGLDHFGFEVDDVQEVQRRINEMYPTVSTTTRPGHRGYVGMASHDPEGHVFDLSFAEMGARRRTVVHGKDGSDRTERHIHHLAMRVLDPAKIAQFYQDVFELQLVKEPGEDRVYHLTDGVLTFAIMPWKITDFAEAGIVERPALDHIGFTVESIAAYQRDLDTLVEEHPEAAPWADKRDEQRLRDERAARAQLLATCEYHETHLWDPECVFFDVREHEAAPA